MPETTGIRRAHELPETLSSYARELYEDGRLVPLLRRLMTVSCALTGSVGSSISIVDPAAGRYTKVAERGTACRLGESFPLDEGVTGRVMVSRRPIVLGSYGDVTTGHLPVGSRARDGAVVAIPIWWRGEVIGANVVFAGCPKAFSSDEIDQLELVTQVVAPGIVTAASRDLGMAALFAGPPSEAPRTAGHSTCVSSVADVARGLASLVTRLTGPDPENLPSVQVRLVRDRAVLRLQVQDGGQRPAGWRELVQDGGGDVRLVLPADAAAAAGAARAPSSPFTAREREVAVLLSRGLSDRAIAEALVISPKTAEKHVGAVLRKTCTSSRTAAVVRALERGWLVEGTSPAR